MRAVVLAAGEGIRLQPTTFTRPKHLIKICGKPILEYCLDAIKTCGVNEAVIVVHYMADAIRNYFGNGDKFGLKIQYVDQQAVRGTGNALSAAEPYVKEDFIMIYGDLLFAAEALKRTIGLHEKEKPAATLAVVPVEKPEDYGIIELENETKIKRLIEKPIREEAQSNLANAGIYVFSQEVFPKIKETSATVRGEWEITDAITLLLKENKLVLAAKLPTEEWFDIGRPWDLLDANQWMLKKMKHKVYGCVEEGAHLIGPITVAEAARIRSGAYVEGPAFIDEESDIGPNCYIRPYTSIGKNVRIGNACEIKNSIIMDNTHIGHLSYIGDSVLGEKCNLGAGTITANYRLDARPIGMMIKDKLVNSERRKLGAILGDNVKTGINSLLMPGVKVGNDSWVGPNLVLSRDLPSGTIALLKQDEEKREMGR